MNSENSSQFVVFDQYQRYHFIQRVIDIVSRGEKKRILEVGGAFSSPLPNLLNGHQLLILDTIEGAKNLDLRASGLQLPFSDETFDIVVSTDVLEHLKPAQRLPFLEQLRRVTSDVVVLGFPHNTLQASQADRILFDFIKNVTGNEYHFLAEHLEHGLPSAPEVKAFLSQNFDEVLEFQNANIYSWLPLMMTYFSLENYPEFDESRKLINDFFNRYYDEFSHDPPAYRTFFVGFKHKPGTGTNRELQKITQNHNPRPSEKFASDVFVISVSFQNALQQKKNEIQQYKNETAEKIKRAEEVMNATIAKLAYEKTSLSAQNKELRNEKTRLADHARELFRERNHLTVQNHQLIGRLAHVEQSLKQREERVKELGSEIEKREKKIRELAFHVQTLQQYLDLFLKHPIYRIYHSLKNLIQSLRGFLRSLFIPIHSRRERILFLGKEGYRLWRLEGYGVPRIGFNAIVQRTMPNGARRILVPVSRAKAFLFWLRCFFTRQGDEKILAQMLQEAHTSFSSGDLTTAETIYQSCLKAFPNNEFAASGLARIKCSLGEYFAAQRILYESITWNPQSFEIQAQLGSLLLASGSFWDAEKLFKALNEAYPRRIEPLIHLADLAMGDARYSDAAGYYKKVLEINPSNLGAVIGIMECAKHTPDAAIILASIRQQNQTKDLARAILEESNSETSSKIQEALVSIIIPVFNKLRYTRSCIELIRNHTTHPFELIVVDNGSTDGTEKYLKSVQGEVIKVIRNQTNLGFVEACNQGAEVAKGKYILFLNNDTLPEPGWLESLVRTAEDDPQVGIVGAKLIYPDGKLQEAGSICFSDGTAWNFGKGDDPRKPEYNYLRETSYCSGACLLIRLDVFDRVRGFDRRYAPAYFEDADLAFAVRKLGYKVVYQPEAKVIHFEGITGGTDMQSGFKRFQEINQLKFQEKWEKQLQDQPVFRADHVRRASHYGSKQPILIIDHYLPIFDRSAGEHRMLELLKLFRANGHHVTFIARNGEYQKRYKILLEQMGVETYATDPDRMIAWNYRTSAIRIDFSTLLQQGQYSTVIISRYQLAETYLPLIRDYSPNTTIIVDTVDVHYLRETRKAALYGSKDLERMAAEIRTAETTIYQQADALITVTGHDAAALQNDLGSGKSIWILPTIHPVPEHSPPYKMRRDLLFVGNFVHPPNSDAVLWFCGQIFPKIQQRLREVRLYIVGANSLSLTRIMDIPNVIVTGYVPNVSPFLNLCRVSVAPLRYGAGMKGKIGQALAHGLPVVTTSIGAEGLGIRNAEHAFVADDPNEFAEAVIRLYTDEKLWTQMSQDAKSMIANSFSPAAVHPIVTKMLNSFCKPAKLQIES